MTENVICICGESGSGKTTSIRNLDPSKTFLIRVTEKPISLPKWKKKYTPLTKQADGTYTGNYYISSNASSILKIMKYVATRKDIEYIVIDDLQYVMSFEFLDRASERSFDKFNEMAQNMLNLIRNSGKILRSDQYLSFFTHSENVGSDIEPKYVIKTLGKLLKEKLTIEGLFTYLLFTKVVKDDVSGEMKYQFITNQDGTCIAKSPMGCFKDLYIDNDLDYVIKRIKVYDGDMEEFESTTENEVDNVEMNSSEEISNDTEEDTEEEFSLD